MLEATDTNCDRVFTRRPTTDVGIRSIAIADGVSQSFDPAPWSATLVQKIPIRAWDDCLVEWLAATAPTLNQPDPSALPWNLAILRERGAQSTLLILEATESNGSWDVEMRSIGDCLAILELSIDGTAECETLFWPFQFEEEMPTVPARLSSESPFVLGETRTHSITTCHPRRALLMTDALARYVMRNTPSPGFAWEMFPVDLTTSDEWFADWIDQLRDDGAIEDDDTTLALLVWE